jgi:DNA-binding Lrp family transcriptional regulator
MKYCQLNTKDFELLEILKKNSRESLKKMSKELKISKQAVSSKLKKLEGGVIINYSTKVNYFRLGNINTHIYFKIQGLEDCIYKKKIIELKKIVNISWVVDLFGDFDLAVSVISKSIEELNNSLNKIYSILGDAIIYKEIHLITSRKSIFMSPINSYVMEPTKEIIRLSELDRKILNYISANARFNYSDLTYNLKLDYHTVKKRIKYLENNKIIYGYGITCNYLNLGTNWNICMLDITPGVNTNKIISFLAKEKSIPFISLSFENTLFFDFISQDNFAIRDFLNKLKKDFPYEIRKYRLLTMNNLFKLEYVY